MKQSDEFVETILALYSKHYFPYLGFAIQDVRQAKDRFYLTHKENSVVISLMPIITKNVQNNR